MAPSTAAHVQFLLHEDTDDAAAHPDTALVNGSEQPPTDINNTLVLGELGVGNLQNTRTTRRSNTCSATTGVSDSSVADSNPSSADPSVICKPARPGKALRARPRIEPDTFVSLSTDVDGSKQGAPPTVAAHLASQATQRAVTDKTLLEIASETSSSDRQQLQKLEAGQFELVLSFPAVRDAARGHTARSSPKSGTSLPGGGGKLQFGCNLVRHRTRSGDKLLAQRGLVEAYTVVATRIVGEESQVDAKGQAVEETGDIAVLDVSDIADFVDMAASTNGISRWRDSSPIVIAGDRDEGGCEHSTPRSPTKPGSRIEDSVEELDKLEEQLEALNAVSRVDRVLSPDAVAPASQVKTSTMRGAPGLKRNDSANRKPVPKSAPGTVRQTPTVLSRNGSVHRQTLALSIEKEKSTANPPARKSLAPRPLSLLPPKPPAKSARPPTIPTFELPGEAVARRLKEKREARLSLQVTAEQATAAVAAVTRTKSNKVPTRPTFELPGEAISRRKRAEQEAKLKAQEEEERKRREFKARPVRNSIAPGSYPRETTASRARQTKTGLAEITNMQDNAPGLSGKRQSMALSRSPVRPALSATTSDSRVVLGKAQAPPARGRGSVAQSPSTAHVSRATSSSTGGINGSGKRSNVSADDVEVQKQRGRNIFHRDSSFSAMREQDQRQREEAAKLARQEAAERSRQLSREWAEKQRLEKLAAATIPGSPAAAVTAKAF